MTGRRPGGTAHDRWRASRPTPGRVADRGLRDWLADSTPVAAGGRAILLQIADPVVAAGVRRHSDFARRPQQRLAHTLMFVYAVVIGTDADAAVATAFVEHAHRPVAGADDVERQLWVAATLFDSARRAHELFGDPLGPDRAEDVLAAYAPIATALRVPAADWFRDVADFDRYWAATLPTLTVTDDARGIVRDLLHPRFAPAWVRAAMPLVRIVTVGMLPDALRAAYGFPWGPREQRRFRRAVRLVRGVRRAVPAALLRLPGPLLLRAMHRTAAQYRAVRPDQFLS
ncbi:oxygenase MpaB family protein [Curtobacterium citreum]|uniref:oxygenase MpaB family protein n=1 Tax=Curtobacterium citreum TaxID=2036 RepID=UPI00073612B5|nr:oxygenase MpaB family protein [Curtobacterium citreum]